MSFSSNIFDISGSKETRWGIEKEPVAKEELEKVLGQKINECGLFIDKEFPYLGTSPDGLISSDTTVEIKCPYSAKGVTPYEGVNNKLVRLDLEKINIFEKYT